MKKTVGEDGTFDFTSGTLSPASFSLTTSGGSAQQVFADLQPGSYDVSETVPAEWTLTSANCDNGDTPDTITLTVGDNVTCTFENTKVTIRKLFLPLIFGPSSGS